MVQLCRFGTGPVLDGVFCNFRHCGDTSWLHGLSEAVAWAKSNADDHDWIDLLDDIEHEKYMESATSPLVATEKVG